MDYKIIKHFPDSEIVQKWETFLTNAELPTHYVTPNYFVDPFFRGGDRFAVLAIDGARIVAVLTGVKSAKSLQSGLGVRPQTAFLIECDRDAAVKALLNGLADLAGDATELINFYSWKSIPGVGDLGYNSEQCTGSELVVMLDLSRGSEALFQDFAARRRTELRKVMKQEKLRVKQLETEAELAELYSIYKEWNARKGFHPDTFDNFQLALEQTAYRRIFIAVNEGRVVAGTYYRFCKGGVIEYAANNSLVEFQSLHPNELITWRAIEWACSAGFSHFCMGGSHPFMTKFGGELVGAFRYRLDRTFLRRHDKRERIQRLAAKIYLALPSSVRTKVKSAASGLPFFRK